MDLLGKLVGGQGCAPDGTAAAQNPLGRLVDSMLDAANATPMAEFHMGRGAGGGGMDNGAMQHALREGMMDGSLGHEGMMMHPPPPPDAVMMGMPPPGDPWATEFMADEMHLRPDMGAVFRPELEEAFLEHHQRMLRGGAAPHTHAHMHHHAHMSARVQQQPPPGHHAMRYVAHAQQQQKMKGRMMMARGDVDAWATEFEAGMRVEQGPPGMKHPEFEAAWMSGHPHTFPSHMMAPPPPQQMLHSMWEHTAHGPQQVHQEVVAEDGTREASAAVLRALGSGEARGNPKFENSEFVGFMKGLRSGRLSFDGNTVVGRDDHSSFEQAWEQPAAGLQESGPSEFDPDLANAWQAAAPEEMAADGLQGAVKDALEAAWQEAGAEKVVDLDEIWRQATESSGVKDPNDIDAMWDQMEQLAAEYDQAARVAGEGGDAAGLRDAWDRTQRELESFGAEEYRFADANEFASVDDPFALGMRLFEAGELARAILAFEAEIQQRPENAEAWRMLGQSHAENDEDKRAITCLERAVEQDAYNLPALLALGVSFVNELDSVRALQNLKAWVQHNPKYQGLEIHLDEYSDGTLMDEVMQLMVQANDWDIATNGREDPDVQVVLGVLYNVSHDYDSAVDAFRKALTERPEDYSLWNKLGATLANSQRSEEALPAYDRALEIKPKYARAWLNMGISHANLSRYYEAARCYLQALKLNPDATHIWGYLRVTFTAMDRFDLMQLAASQNPDLFDEEFRTTLA